MKTHHELTRRGALLRTGAALLCSAAPLGSLAAADLPTMEVVKTPTCGCCTAWIDMAREAGFQVSVTDTTDYAGMKKDAGVPRRLASCHTARVGGYVVEGHVPFAAIHAMLREQPDIAGISVPGMPTDSPGMGGGVDAVVPVTAWGGTAGKGAPYDFEAN